MEIIKSIHDELYHVKVNGISNVNVLDEDPQPICFIGLRSEDYWWQTLLGTIFGSPKMLLFGQCLQGLPKPLWLKSSFWKLWMWPRFLCGLCQNIPFMLPGRLMFVTNSWYIIQYLSGRVDNSDASLLTLVRDGTSLGIPLYAHLFPKSNYFDLMSAKRPVSFGDSVLRFCHHNIAFNTSCCHTYTLGYRIDYTRYPSQCCTPCHADHLRFNGEQLHK